MSEIYYTGEVSRTMFERDSERAAEVVNLIRPSFPWIRLDDYFSVSSPAFHEVLQEPVVTACLPVSWTHQTVGTQYALGNRKFCLNSGTSFLRLYALFQDQKPAFLPPSAKVLFIGTNHAEYGRPYPELADTFHDLYFMGDPAEIEATFNLPERRGAYETMYGVTVVNGQPVRVKQYIYDDQGGFSDWDVVWHMQCKRQGRQDLLGI